MHRLGGTVAGLPRVDHGGTTPRASQQQTGREPGQSCSHDEVLHAARLSPFALAASLTEEEVARLYEALRTTLTAAVMAAEGKPAAQLKDAKRAGMNVHGRTGEACPVCGDTVREVSFADSSLQYCPTCQTGGKPLADRRMSRLLK